MQAIVHEVNIDVTILEKYFVAFCNKSQKPFSTTICCHYRGQPVLASTCS